MRTVMIDQRFDAGLLWNAVGLNALYVAAGMAVFLWMFRVARRRGLLVQVGE